MNMKICEECGKKLGFFEGYRHLTLGKEFLLCSSCFDRVDESVTKWREFVLSYAEFFDNGFSKKGCLPWSPKKIQPCFAQMYKRFKPAYKLESN
jgi:hypothetical protein